MASPELHLDLRKLRYFVQAVEARSLSRAATQLLVAQPALSKSIKALEDDLQTVLLRRSAHGVEPTDAGKRLYEHCQIIARQVERASADVRRTGQRPLGRVALGMPYTIGSVLALPLVKAISAELPEIRLELVQEHSHQLAPQVRSGRLDFAVMARPRSHAGLHIVPLLLEELFFVERAGAERETGAPPISFAEAARRPFILPSIGNGLRVVAEGYFKARSLPLEVAHEIDAPGLIPQCIEAGLGVSLLPGGALQQSPSFRNLAMRPIEGGCHRLIVLCHPTSALAPAAAATSSLVERLAAELIAAGEWLGARQV